MFAGNVRFHLKFILMIFIWCWIICQYGDLFCSQPWPISSQQNEQNFLMENEYCSRKRFSWEIHHLIQPFYRTKCTNFHLIRTKTAFMLFTQKSADIFGLQFSMNFEIILDLNFSLSWENALNRNWNFRFHAYRRIVHNA